MRVMQTCEPAQVQAGGVGAFGKDSGEVKAGMGR